MENNPHAGKWRQVGPWHLLNILPNWIDGDSG